MKLSPQKKELNEILIEDIMNKHIDDGTEETIKNNKNTTYLFMVLSFCCAIFFLFNLYEKNEINKQHINNKTFLSSKGNIHPSKLDNTSMYYHLVDLNRNLVRVNQDEYKDMENIPRNSHDDIYKNGQISEKYLEKYSNFLKSATREWTEEEIYKYRETLYYAKKITDPSPHLLTQIKDLELLIGNDKNVQILNEYRKNLTNKNFLTLIETQNIQEMWDTYFKAKYGTEVSDTLKYLIGII